MLFLFEVAFPKRLGKAFFLPLNTTFLTYLTLHVSFTTVFPIKTKDYSDLIIGRKCYEINFIVKPKSFHKT